MYRLGHNRVIAADIPVKPKLKKKGRTFHKEFDKRGTEKLFLRAHFHLQDTIILDFSSGRSPHVPLSRALRPLNTRGPLFAPAWGVRGASSYWLTGT